MFFFRFFFLFSFFIIIFFLHSTRALGALGLLLLLLALGHTDKPVEEEGTADVEDDVHPEDAEVAPPLTCWRVILVKAIIAREWVEGNSETYHNRS